MRKLLLASMLTLFAALALSSIVVAQNAPAPAAPQQDRAETKPWNAPEKQRATPPAMTPARPPLFFRETWKVPSGEPRATNPDGCCWPISPESVASPNLELKLYGSGKDLGVLGNPADEGNPVHAFSGLCNIACGVGYQDKNNYVDLSRGKIKWAIKTTGFHVVRPVLRLADGTYLVGDFSDTAPGDWRTTEFYPYELRWLKLDPDRATAYGNFITKPDLTKVDEVGWVDLMAGNGHNGGDADDVGTVEVYGKPVSRSGNVQSQLTK